MSMTFQGFTDEDLMLADKIIRFAKREAAMTFPFLEKGIYYLEPAATTEINTIAADYTTLYFNPAGVIEMFSKDSSKVTEAIIHCVLHCLLKHISYTLSDQKTADACMDIAVESMIDNTGKYSHGEARGIAAECGSGTAAGLYNAAMEDGKMEKRIRAFSRKRCCDDHDVWRNPPKNSIPRGSSRNGDGDGQHMEISSGGENKSADEKEKDPCQDDNRQNDNRQDDNRQNDNRQNGGMSLQEQEQAWDRMMSSAMSRSSMSYGTGSGNMFADIRPPSRFSRFSYLEYIRQFALSEIVQEDPETFDVMLYTAGMDMFGDVCLVEPNEVRESVSPTDIIFAIDMSGSCGGEVAENFLRQIYSVFDQMNIRSGVNIHVVFFDTEILNTMIIRSKNDADQFVRSYKGMGFGGTDFNCVFNYADRFSDSSGGKRLKGLFFFSDACGNFPINKPGYRTTFFVPEDSSWSMEDYSFVPDWVELVKYNDK